MFMVKGEFANIGNLVKVRLKTQAKDFYWFCIVAAIMLCGGIAMTVSGIAGNSDFGVYNYSLTDYSASFFLGVIVAVIVIAFMYRQMNDKLSVFPQTNNSRFISTQILGYMIVVGVAATALVMYLLCYASVSILSAFVDNIYLALDFNAGFIAAGFFIFLAYSFLIVALIELAAACLRKWTYYAAAILTALIVLAIVNIGPVVDYAPKVLSFLINEQSVVFLILKAAALWLMIVAASLVINRFTVYHKSAAKRLGVKIACVVIAVVVVIAVPAVLMYSSNTVSGSGVAPVPENQNVDDFIGDFYSGSERIRIDASHLPRGSRIDIRGESIILAAGGAVVVTGGRNTMAYVGGMDLLSDLQGDTIVIEYRPPFYHVNGISLFDYANPRLDAYLDGETLYLSYAVENAHVVILPIWGIARQFEGFRDRGLLTENLLGFSAGGSMNANINISVE